MKWVLLLMLVAGAALAEEQEKEVEEKEEGRFLFNSLAGLTAAKTTFLGVVASGFSLASQIVILVALILLIVTLKKAKDDIYSSGYGYDYEYYHAPAYEHGGYDASGGSSYASGYSKRSADFPSFLNLPVVQRLTEKVHNAIEQFTEQHH